MSASAPILTRTWSVGSYTCTMSIPKPKPGAAVHFAVEWTPSLPTRLNAAELAQYRNGRDAALLELGKVLGGRVVVLEV